MQILDIQRRDGAWALGSLDAFRPLLKGVAPVGEFGPGWSPLLAVALNADLIVLALGHNDGRRAGWMLDGEMVFVADRLDGLPDAPRAVIEAAARSVLPGVGRYHLMGPAFARRCHAECGAGQYSGPRRSGAGRMPPGAGDDRAGGAK